MTIFDFMTAVFHAFIIYTTASAIINWVRQRKMNQNLSEEVLEIDEETTKLVTVEVVEQSGRTYWLVHGLHDKEFIAQGFSEEEALKNTLERCPGKTIFQVVENN